MESISSWHIKQTLPPLQLPYSNLQEKVNLRPGEFLIIAGAEGSGKSTLAVNLAASFPTLYCAQDQPPHIRTRLNALLLDITTNQAAFYADTDPQQLAQQLTALNNHQLIINSGRVSSDRIRIMTEAYEEYNGHSPDIVIVDNLIDCIVDNLDYHDNKFYARLLPELKEMAEELETVVVGLHHVKRPSVGDVWPMKSQSLIYGGERAAAHVWGVRVRDDSFGPMLDIAILKQRMGPADRNGKMVVTLEWEPEYGKVR